jgi:four helix bundle protein
MVSKRWRVAELAFEQQLEIFKLTKTFPKEELYSLTTQVRRSSRSVCANLSEAYRKKRYPQHFALKLTDAMAENSETETWIEIALSCEYINMTERDELLDKNSQIGKLLSYMLNNANDFLHNP